MTKAKKKESAPERAEYPKPLVRLRAIVGGYDAEVRMVADGDAESDAKAEGFEPVTVPEQPSDFQEYPKMVYGPEGQQVIVQSEAEEEKLGYAETPAEPATKSA